MARRLGIWPERLSLQSIRGRLALLLALAFLPAGAIAIQAGMSSLAARNSALQGEEGVRVVHRLNAVRDVATQLREGVRTLAASAELFADSSRACHEILADFAAQFANPSVLAILDEGGVVQCANLPDVRGHTTAAQPLIVAARDGGDVALGFIPAPQLSLGPSIGAVARTDAGHDGAPLYVGATQDLDALLRRLRPDDQRTGGFVAMVDASGAFLTGVGLTRDSADAHAIAASFHDSGAANLRTAFRIDGKWAVAMPVEDGGDLYLVQAWTPARPGAIALLFAGWTLLGPLLLWLGAVGATWLAVEYFVARPLLVVEGLARAYARGEDSESDEALIRNAPLEITNLRRTMAAMAKTLRGREARISAALQEERALLLEVNHRVKNNLQMITSILSIQARATSDPSEARGLARAQDRVHLLALAHTQIYASGEVRRLALDHLALEIVRALTSARGAAAARIALDLKLSPVRANADRAVPIAFLIGECVSSILDLEDADIIIDALSIALAPMGEDGFILEIDASAKSRELPAPSPTSQRLINAFARQIGAEIKHDPARPCWVRITCAAVLDEV